MNHYSVSEGQLVIRDGQGTELWRGRLEGHAVIWAATLPDSEDGVALYEPYPAEWQKMQCATLQNLMRVAPDGRIIWRAELPERHSRYVRAKLLPGAIEAIAPSYTIRLDIGSGRILEQIWTK